MSRHTHQDWLNRNSLRSFPLRSGVETVNPALLTDAFLSVPDSVTGVGLSHLFCSQNLVTAHFVDTGSGDPLFTATIPLLESFTFNRIQVVPVMDGVAGTICSGPVQPGMMPLGTQTFSPPIRLEERCLIRIWPFPITSLNGDDRLDPLAGDVRLDFQSPLAVVESQEEDDEGRVSTFFTISLTDQRPYLSVCTKEACDRKPILSINSVSPDEDGKITIQFVGFTVVTPEASGTELTYAGDQSVICQKLEMPDEDGRLPGGQDTGTF